MALFAGGSALAAASPNLPLLVFARVVQGMGGAMMMPVPRLVVLRAYDKTRLLGIMNFIIMPALLGPVMGPLVGGYLVEYASWHWIFLINVPIGIIGMVMTLRLMPDFYAPDGERPHFDVLGFLLFSSGAVNSRNPNALPAKSARGTGRPVAGEEDDGTADARNTRATRRTPASSQRRAARRKERGMPRSVAARRT